MRNTTIGKTIQGCINPKNIPDGNLYYNGLNFLDGQDAWQSYINTHHNKYFTEQEWKNFNIENMSGCVSHKYDTQLQSLMSGYTTFLKNTGYIRTIDGVQQGLLSEYGEQRFVDKVNKIIYRYKSGYLKKIDLFSPGITHRNVLGKIDPEGFNRIVGDKSYAEKYFGNDIDTITYQNFCYLNNKKGVIDFLPDEVKQSLPIGQYTALLYDVSGKKTKLAENQTIGLLTIEYLDKLNIKQQLKQIEFTTNKTLNGFEKFSYVMKKSFYGINNIIYKLVKRIASPAIYSTFLSFWGGIEGFTALIILNSSMFLSDVFQRKKTIKGDWKSFAKQLGIIDSITLIDHFKGSFKEGLEYIRGETKKLLSTGLFNVADNLIENNYKIQVAHNFFTQLFPGVTDVKTLSALLDNLKDTDPDQYTKLINTLHTLIDQSMTQQMGKQGIGVTKITKPTVGGPLKEIGHVLYNFFANWGRGKTQGALKIIRNCLDGKHFKGFAKYLDDMYGEGKDIDYILGEYHKIQFDLSELEYFLEKIYITFLMSKYCVRIMATDDEDTTTFSSFNEYLDYINIFEGNLNALSTLPEYKIIATALETFIGLNDLDATVSDVAMGTVANTTKQLLNILARGLFLPKIGIETKALIEHNRNNEEKTWMDYLNQAIHDNCNGFLFYLKSTIDDGLQTYYFPAGPKRILKDFFGIQNKEIAYINNEKNKLKLLKAVNSKENFNSRIIYNFPFIKQYNIGQFDETDTDFINAVNDFRDSQAYHELINNKFPSDMTDENWLFVYNTIEKRIQNKKGAIQTNLYTLYRYTDKETEEVKTTIDVQLQENIIDYCMRHGLTKEQLLDFQKQLKSTKSVYQEEAIKTLAYLEANEPGAGLQALAYIMQKESFKLAYEGVTSETSDEEIKQRRKDAQIEIAKKYAKYIPYVDKQRSYPQIILDYADTHGYRLSKYIAGTDETGFKSVSVTTTNGKYNSLFNDTFKAQLVTDIMAAAGNLNAYKIKNAYGQIYDITKIYNKDGSIDKQMAKYMLNSLNAVYAHIDSLALSEGEERVLKQGALMFNEQFIDSIIHNPTAMADNSIKTAVGDWLHYRYKEFDELSELAEKYAEEELEAKTYSVYLPKKWNNRRRGKKYYNSGGYKRDRYSYYNKRGLSNWYNTMKNKAYGERFNYRVYNWKPTQYNVDYLSETDYANIKKTMQNIRTVVSGGSSGKNRGGKGQDDAGIGVMTKRGKAFQMYKMEDPNKPVEYARPRRARFVRKGKGTEPISTTTWKQLQK